MTDYETTISPYTKTARVTCPLCHEKVLADNTQQRTVMLNGKTTRFAVVVTQCKCKARVEVGLKA